VLLAFAFPACSLEGLAGGRVDGGGVTDGSTVDGGVPTPGSDAAVGDGGPGCPGCEVLLANEEQPTELAQGGDRLHWIRRGPAGHVVSSELDGRNIEFDGDVSIDEGHDLVAFEIEAFALDASGRLSRYLSASTCTDAGGVVRLARFGGEMLIAKTNALFRGDCGERTLLASIPAVIAVAGDPPYAWFARSDGTIERCDASGSACESSRGVLASGQGRVTQLAHDDARVVWATEQGEVRSRAKTAIGATGDADVLASGVNVKALASFGGDVYFTDVEGGTIRRVPAGSTTPIVFASGLARPWGLLVTPPYVYVAESGAGRILRMPR